MRHRLAAVYNVSTHRISIVAAAGSTLLTIAISSSEGAAERARPAGNVAMVGASDAASSLATQVSLVNASILAASLGVQLSGLTEPSLRARNVSYTSVVLRPVATICARGYWCTAGMSVACLAGFYNPAAGANNQTACLACPPHSSTAESASPSVDDCMCDAGFVEWRDGFRQRSCVRPRPAEHCSHSYCTRSTLRLHSCVQIPGTLPLPRHTPPTRHPDPSATACMSSVCFVEAFLSAISTCVFMPRVFLVHTIPSPPTFLLPPPTVPSPSPLAFPPQVCDVGNGIVRDTSGERCAPCEPGRYKPALGNDFCLACPYGEWSTTKPDLGAVSVDECGCSAQFYLPPPATPSSLQGAVQECAKCPVAGTACNRSGVTLASLPLLPGFWRAHSSSTIIRACRMPGVCPGGTNASLCGHGHLDGSPYCSVCERGFFASAAGCVRCGNVMSFLPLLLTVTVVFLLVALGCSVGSKKVQRSGKDERSAAEVRSRAARLGSAINKHMGSVKVHVIIALYQV